MNIDIRTPIGWMFVVLGILLTLYGAISDPALYDRSLGVNVNLWWGVPLLAFGVTFVFFGRRAARMRCEPGTTRA